jgi:hypothetical protein
MSDGRTDTRETEDAVTNELTTELSEAPARAIPAITKDRLNDQGNGEVTATVGALPGLCRDDGSPAQVGDVLSVQNDGSYQARPQGTNGWNERAVIGSAGLVYRPLLNDALPDWAWIVPLVDVWPNGGE